MADQNWQQIKAGIIDVMNPLEVALSYNRYMELYTQVYNYCTRTAPRQQNRTGANLMGGELYFTLKDFFIDHLNGTLKSMGDENVLQFYARHWTRYTMGGTLVHHIFKYLNRHWIKREMDEGHKHIYDVYTLSLVAWKEHFLIALEEKVSAELLLLIQSQRNGNSIDTLLIKNIIDSFVSLGLDESDSSKSTLDVYKKYFENPFIQDTAMFYSSESKQILESSPLTEYMEKVEIRLNEEVTRVNLYVHQSSQEILNRTCEEYLITKNLTIIQDEFGVLLDQDRVDDLSRMFRLLARIPNGLDKLRRDYEVYTKAQGLQALEKVLLSSSVQEEEVEEAGDVAKKSKTKSHEADPKVFVDTLLSVHKKYSQLVMDAFSGEAGFVASLDRACREFVNNNAVCKGNSTKSPELLAKYCDSLLRKSSKVAENSEVEEILTNVMVVFKYVEDKDVFQKFYSKLLANRLVNDTSASDDSEAFMIAKLKEACGFEYTSKLQRMFTDKDVSNDLTSAFSDQMEKTHSKNELLDFGILVMGSASWPLKAPSTNFNIPEELLKTYERFQAFYQSKHTGRKLTWLFQLSKGELKTTYVNGKTFTFQVSTYQMGILLQYNNGLKYTFEQLQTATALEPETLQGNLDIFLKSKVLVLIDDYYTLNTDLKLKKIRINLNQPIRSEQKKETEETHKNVEEDRKLLIQAAIVRVMKSRKTLVHNALIQEVITQLQTRFKPNIQMIKKAIEQLMEKEYIERVDGEKDTYSYIA